MGKFDNTQQVYTKKVLAKSKFSVKVIDFRDFQKPYSEKMFPIEDKYLFTHTSGCGLPKLS